MIDDKTKVELQRIAAGDGDLAVIARAVLDIVADGGKAAVDKEIKDALRNL